MKNLIFALSFLLFSCQSQTEVHNIKDFYFPVEDFTESKVYHYSSGAQPENQLYWKFTTEKHNNQVLFITDSYSHNPDGSIHPIEKITEEVNDEGSFVIDYFTYKKINDSTTLEIDATLKEKCVAQWEVSKNDTVEWSFSQKNYPEINQTEVVSKKRALKNTNTTVKFNGKTYDAVVFHDLFTITRFKTNSKKLIGQFELLQISYYAKGIGMVKYTRKFPNGEEIKYELEEILTEKEWKNTNPRKI